MRSFPQLLNRYRVGAAQTVAELSGDERLEFKLNLSRLIDEIVLQGDTRRVLVTGTAGDGKTHFALELLRAWEKAGRARDDWHLELDLSAGEAEAKLATLREALDEGKGVIVCANSGKLDVLENALDGFERLDLSHRAALAPSAFTVIWDGITDPERWSAGCQRTGCVLCQNRAALAQDQIRERLRQLLLIPYFLGEPITIRELVSACVATVTGGLDCERAESLETPADKAPYRYWNAAFSAPDGHIHGREALPPEKLLYWLFRCDPGWATAPRSDLELVSRHAAGDTELPHELLELRREAMAEDGDPAAFVSGARRWLYFNGPDEIAHRYLPFTTLPDYARLIESGSDLSTALRDVIDGLNAVISRWQVSGGANRLRLFHLPADEARPYLVKLEDVVARRDLQLDPEDSRVEGIEREYLEGLPRRLVLVHPRTGSQLAVGLGLYEVLRSATVRHSFPGSLWLRERASVRRFVERLALAVEGEDEDLEMEYLALREDGPRLGLSYIADENVLEVRPA